MHGLVRTYALRPVAIYEHKSTDCYARALLTLADLWPVHAAEQD
jgi:hypothetical protein